MLRRTTKLQLAKDGKNEAFSSFDLYDHADRTSFSKLRNCFILTHCFQIISNCVVAKTVLKIMCKLRIQPVVLCDETQERTLLSSIDLFLER